MAEILDSGERTEFQSGAVRDLHGKEKGRCDLLPLEIVDDLLKFEDDGSFHGISVLDNIMLFMSEPHYTKADQDFIFQAITEFCHQNGWDIPTAILEVSIHFADGCTKYGERNWEKGIPCHCFVDSAIRHYLKWWRGDTDEPHDRAFVWNLLCLLWTMIHRPECNDLWENEDGDG